MSRNSKIRSRAVMAVAVVALAAPAAAGAHVTIQPNELKAGGFARMDVRVPSERDDANTTKVQVQFPPGLFFLSYEPKPGWKVDIRREKLSKPVELFGEKQTEQIRDVTIESTSGNKGIRPGQFLDFGLSGGPIPDKAGTSLSFKAIQTYSSGEVVRWIAPDPEADTPAPQVKILSADGGATKPAAGAAPAASNNDDSGGASKGLGIAALVLGGLGLLIGLAAFATGRKRLARV